MIFIAILILILLSGCSNQSDDVLLKQYKITSFSVEQKKLLEIHNKERTSRGYAPLILDKNLCDYAQKHSDNMVKKNSLYHSSMSDIKKANPDTSWVGENVAWGQENEQAVVDAWMWSPGHRWNILGSKYKKVGFGISKDSRKTFDGKIYWCAVFTD